MRRFALFSLVLLPLACSDDASGVSGPPVSDQASASEGFTALSTVLGMIGTAPPAGLESDESNDVRDSNVAFRSTDVEVDVAVDCPGGGKASVKGTFSQGGDAGGGFDPENPGGGVMLDISFDYRMSFDNCTAGDVTIDGSLNYAMDIEVDSDAQTYAYSFFFTGKVGFSGAVSGTCSIDATGSASSDSPNEISYEGSICGFDAEELDV